MKLNSKISLSYQNKSIVLEGSISKFNTSGKVIFDGGRNQIKTHQIDDIIINIKSFKIPNLINKIAYRFFRKSKAHRSFEYAEKLTKLGVDTPKPIAYYEFTSLFFFNRSFYISEHLSYNLTFRELTTDLDYPNHEKILRAFTRFTFELHEKGVNFLDHSPGNTLIQSNKNDYSFYLVDLNRMRFEQMDLNKRLKNFSKLTNHQSLVKVMSAEYAKLSKLPFDDVYKKMWFYTEEFQEKLQRKKRLKQKYLGRK